MNDTAGSDAANRPRPGVNREHPEGRLDVKVVAERGRDLISPAELKHARATERGERPGVDNDPVSHCVRRRRNVRAAGGTARRDPPCG